MKTNNNHFRNALFLTQITGSISELIYDANVHQAIDRMRQATPGERPRSCWQDK